MMTSRRLGTLGALVLGGAVVVSCGSKGSGFDDENGPDGGAQGRDEVGTFGGDGGGSSVSRDAACAASLEATERAPGALILVVDRSFSMTEGPDGNAPRAGAESKWSSAEAALRTMVKDLPAAGLRLGLQMFPSGGDGCGVASQPEVSIGDIGATRSAVLGVIGGASPSGQTPTTPALDQAYAALKGDSASGSRAALFVSDGQPNCGSSQVSVEASVAKAAQAGIKTYVIGIPGSPSSSFSKLAVEGGTRRSPACVEDCGAGWGDIEKCCHYATTSRDFAGELRKALEEIAAKLRTDCVYRVPRPEGKPFNAAQVNVVVTVPPAAEQILPQSADPQAGGWSYTDQSYQRLVIHGATCAAILGSRESKVEVLVGCPTIIK